MRTSGGQLVTPQLYLQGLGKGGEYSKKMVEFKTEFNELVNKYSIKQVK